MTEPVHFQHSLLADLLSGVGPKLPVTACSMTHSKVQKAAPENGAS